MRSDANGEAGTVIYTPAHAWYPVHARVHTLAWASGSEFAEHTLVDIVLTAKSYFAEPYSSRQRGTNQNTNGLVRQHLPKSYDFGSCSDADIQVVEDKFNRGPRKRLNFRTSQQAFHVSLNRGGLPS